MILWKCIGQRYEDCDLMLWIYLGIFWVLSRVYIGECILFIFRLSEIEISVLFHSCSIELSETRAGSPIYVETYSVS